MARKTNYSFEKRQRELQKKEKKAAKAEAKRAARQGGDDSALEPDVDTPDPVQTEPAQDKPVE